MKLSLSAVDLDLKGKEEEKVDAGSRERVQSTDEIEKLDDMAIAQAVAEIEAEIKAENSNSGISSEMILFGLAIVAAAVIAKLMLS